jgi:hypothetical protein
MILGLRVRLKVNNAVEKEVGFAVFALISVSSEVVA